MPLGKAQIVLAITVVALILGFAIPEMYSGLSSASDELGGGYMKGLPMALLGLSFVAILVIVSATIMKVVGNA